MSVTKAQYYRAVNLIKENYKIKEEEPDSKKEIQAVIKRLVKNKQEIETSLKTIRNYKITCAYGSLSFLIGRIDIIFSRYFGILKRAKQQSNMLEQHIHRLNAQIDPAKKAAGDDDLEDRSAKKENETLKKEIETLRQQAKDAKNDAEEKAKAAENKARAAEAAKLEAERQAQVAAEAVKERAKAAEAAQKAAEKGKVDAITAKEDGPSKKQDTAPSGPVNLISDLPRKPMTKTPPNSTNSATSSTKTTATTATTDTTTTVANHKTSPGTSSRLFQPTASSLGKAKHQSTAAATAIPPAASARRSSIPGAAANKNSTKTPIALPNKVASKDKSAITKTKPEETVVSVESDGNPKGFDAVVGMKQLKNEMQQIISCLLDPNLAKQYSVRPSNGILFFGPPGNGKTNFAKRFAEQIEIATKKKVAFHIMNSSVHASKHGETNANIRTGFENAAKDAVTNDNISILFIDEIDGIIPSGKGGSNDDLYSSIRTTFLPLLDSASQNRILVLGATNYPEKLDDAVKRPGRIDAKILIPNPDKEMRLSLLETFFGPAPKEDGLTFGALSSSMDGWSIAEIKTFAESVCRKAFDETVAMRAKEPEANIKISQAMIDEIFTKSLQAKDALKQEHEKRLKKEADLKKAPPSPPEPRPTITPDVVTTHI